MRDYFTRKLDLPGDSRFDHDVMGIRDYDLAPLAVLDNVVDGEYVGQAVDLMRLAADDNYVKGFARVAIQLDRLPSQSVPMKLANLPDLFASRLRDEVRNYLWGSQRWKILALIASIVLLLIPTVLCFLGVCQSGVDDPVAVFFGIFFAGVVCQVAICSVMLRRLRRRVDRLLEPLLVASK